jgi:hypothetical protein
MGEDIRAYMIMHELRLVEVPINNDGIQIGDRVVTHKEYHIIDINEDDEDEEISKRFDAKIKYRPICTKGGKDYKAIIIDTIKIINTIDSSSYEVTGSIDISNPKKYGLRFKKLDINRPIINVYNKSNQSGNSGSGSGGTDGGGTGGSPLGSATGFLKGTLLGLGSGSEGGTGGSGSGGTGSISGTVSGNLPGLGKITGAINGKITNSSSSGNNNINIEGPISISLAGSSYGGGAGFGSNGSGEVIFLNKNGGLVVENNSQNITSFIECTNVGVSIVELSPDDIN